MAKSNRLYPLKAWIAWWHSYCLTFDRLFYWRRSLVSEKRPRDNKARLSVTFQANTIQIDNMFLLYIGIFFFYNQMSESLNAVSNIIILILFRYSYSHYIYFKLLESMHTCFYRNKNIITIDTRLFLFHHFDYNYLCVIYLSIVVIVIYVQFM